MRALFRETMSRDWRSTTSTQPERAWRIVQWYGETISPDSIGWPAIDGLVDELQRKGRSTSTIRAYLSALKVMLQRAARLGWIQDVPPFPEGRTLPLPEARDLVLQPGWIDRLQEHLGPDHRDLVVFLRHTAARVSEGMALRWTEVRLDQGTAQFINTKGGRARTIPLHRDAIAVLEHRNHGSTEQVFPFSQVTFRKAYLSARDKVCRDLSLPADVRAKWVIHTLRHTKLTELAGQGWSAPQLMAFAGHSSMRVTEKYIHSSAINFPSFQ